MMEEGGACDGKGDYVEKDKTTKGNMVPKRGQRRAWLNKSRQCGSKKRAYLQQVGRRAADVGINKRSRLAWFCCQTIDK